MSAFVVDTNVPIVANRKCEHADPACVIACIDALEEVIRRGTIVLDSGMRILEEYLDHLGLSGQPGAGDAFLKWVWTVQAVRKRCEQVSISPHPDEPGSYLEFPNDPGLRTFDPSDRKFVAVACVSARRPAVLNAVDSDWAQHHQALARCGVSVRFLCPQHVCPP